MLPRSKIELQNSWRRWHEDRAVAHQYSLVYKSNLGVALAQEVSWMMTAPDLEENLTKRLAKMASLIAVAKNGDISAFDPYWQDRLALLQWFQT